MRPRANRVGNNSVRCCLSMILVDLESLVAPGKAALKWAVTSGEVVGYLNADE